jgi:hypothetical protein
MELSAGALLAGVETALGGLEHLPVPAQDPGQEVNV